MSAIFEVYQHALMLICLWALIGIGLLGIVVYNYKMFAMIWDRIGKNKGRAVAFGLMAVAAYYGATKPFSPTITYPRTDLEYTWLYDNGSAVSNDFLKIKFTKNVLLPSTANIFVDGLASQYTNQEDWVEHAVNAYSNTIDQSGYDFNVPFANATNYNWIVYSDYAMPPVVHTNGIAYVQWQQNANPTNRHHLVPIRTSIITYKGYLAQRLAPNVTNEVCKPLPPVTTNHTDRGTR